MALNKTELIDKISSLKRQRKAVILAHNYQPGEIQDIADFIGDSLELSQKAAETSAAVIVFCGVHFMAETAAILCPDKTVLLPDAEAGCPMAAMVTPESLREMKGKLPDAATVCYINSTAGVKAESDVCCTSANAVKIVDSLENNRILFVPDENLGLYVCDNLKKDGEMFLWPGYCPVHAGITTEDIKQRRSEHPGASVVVHPECRPEVIALADEVLSTGGICRYARREDVRSMIVGTETGIIYRLHKENPGKEFIPASTRAVCPDMKRITLEEVAQSLETLSPRVSVPEETRIKAKASIERMLAAG